MKRLMFFGVLLVVASHGYGLKQEQLDEFLKTKQGNGIDLSGADLSSKDLNRANLDGANLEGAKLNEANLSYASLCKANLKSVTAHGVNCCYANMTGADLSNADFSSSVTEKTVSEQKRGKVQTRTVPVVGKKTFMSYAKLTDTTVRKTNFKYADLNYVDFSNSQWTNDELMTGATVVHANFKGATGNYNVTGLAIDFQKSMVAYQQ